MENEHAAYSIPYACICISLILQTACTSKALLQLFPQRVAQVHLLTEDHHDPVSLLGQPDAPLRLLFARATEALS